jgi:predicted membrane protein
MCCKLTNDQKRAVLREIHCFTLAAFLIGIIALVCSIIPSKVLGISALVAMSCSIVSLAIFIVLHATWKMSEAALKDAKAERERQQELMENPQLQDQQTKESGESEESISEA